jgi:cytochrome c oxidase assembly protein subunit 11
MTQTHTPLLRRLLLLATAMFGFGFALVPLYNAFCQATGFNGTSAGGPVTVAFRPEPERTVWVELLANANTQAPWSFRPVVDRIAVHPGQLYTTRFLAENPTAARHTVQAVSSVTPGVAAPYLKKVECFCFRRQPFAGHEARELPLRFALDPALPPEIGTLSLAYTLFDVPGG